MRITPCEACNGQRLKQESLAVTVADKNIYEMTDMSIKRSVEISGRNMKLTEQQQFIGDQILKEIRARVGFLMDVGLDYLSLVTCDRHTCPAARHSVSVWLPRSVPDWWACAYILDEPSIGLHQRDNDKLLNALKNLARSGKYADRRGT